jgi:hypothetical protein
MAATVAVGVVVVKVVVAAADEMTARLAGRFELTVNGKWQMVSKSERHLPSTTTSVASSHL